MSIFRQGRETYKSDLTLGERYRDKTTGVEGHLVSIHFFEHACERGSLRYLDGDNNVQEASFDAPELVKVPTVADPEPEPVRTTRTGGPERGSGARVLSSR